MSRVLRGSVLTLPREKLFCDENRVVRAPFICPLADAHWAHSLLKFGCSLQGTSHFSSQKKWGNRFEPLLHCVGSHEGQSCEMKAGGWVPMNFTGSLPWMGEFGRGWAQDLCVFAHGSARHTHLQLNMHFVRLRNISLCPAKQVNKTEGEIYTVSACLCGEKKTLFSAVKTKTTERIKAVVCMIIL